MSKQVQFGAGALAGAATIVAMAVVLCLALVLRSAGTHDARIAASGHQVRVQMMGASDDRVSDMLAGTSGATVIATSGHQEEDAACSAPTLSTSAVVGVGTMLAPVGGPVPQFRTLIQPRSCSGFGSVALTAALTGGTQLVAISAAGGSAEHQRERLAAGPVCSGRVDLPTYPVVARSRCLQPSGALL